MEYFACKELQSLTRSLIGAIERKNELIAANLSGDCMIAAEADLAQAHELIRNHRRACPSCSTFWQQDFNNVSLADDTDEEKYPPRRARTAASRATHPHHPAAILQFPSHNSHPRSTAHVSGAATLKPTATSVRGSKY